MPGTMVERTGPLSYLVQVSDNRIWKRHIDHLRPMSDGPQVEETVEQTPSFNPSQMRVPVVVPTVPKPSESGMEQSMAPPVGGDCS